MKIKKKTIEEISFDIAQDKQDGEFRRMGGSERATLAFGFSHLIRTVVEDGIRSQHPEFSSKKIQKELAKRISFSNSLWKNKPKFLKK